VRLVITVLGKLFAKPVEKGILPIVDIIDNPPAEEFSAYKAAKKLDHTPTEGDREDAERLYRETKRRLGS
jgi:hypothetical protein